MATAAPAAAPTAAPARLPRVLRWIATLLLALPLFAAGLPKLLGQGGWVRMFAHWGYPAWLVPIVGTGEVLGVALMLVPRFASVGASMIAVVMAGAAVTHMLHDETPRVVFTSILCVLAILIAWSRRHNLHRLAPR
jgi:uncharacterized membrane protein YphA (DoxX/SURF4 family)